MRHVVAFGLIALLAMPLVPTVEAKPVCVAGEPRCEGYLVCYFPDFIPIFGICVQDPCLVTPCAMTVRVEDADAGANFVTLA